jgi:hypothetical protein
MANIDMVREEVSVLKSETSTDIVTVVFCKTRNQTIESTIWKHKSSDVINEYMKYMRWILIVYAHMYVTHR